jgi:hypothetical protein
MRDTSGHDIHTLYPLAMGSCLRTHPVDFLKTPGSSPCLRYAFGLVGLGEKIKASQVTNAT